MKKSLIFSVIFGVLVAVYVGMTNQKAPASHVGDTVKIIAGPNSDDVPVATTKEVDDEYSKMLNAKDVRGYNQLFSSGKMFRVDKGTKALVIERSYAMAQVRILEGAHEGKAGWVPVEFAAKQGGAAEEQKRTSTAPQAQKTLNMKPDAFVSEFNSALATLFDATGGDKKVNAALGQVFSIKSHSVEQGGINDVFNAYAGPLETFIVGSISKESGHLKSVAVLLTKNTEMAINEWVIVAKATVLATSKGATQNTVSQAIGRLSKAVTTSPGAVAKEQIGGITLSASTAPQGVILQVEP